MKAFAILSALGVASANPFEKIKTPTEAETRHLWERRLKQLSEILTSGNLEETAFREFLAENEIASTRYYAANEEEKLHRQSVFRENVKKALKLNVKSDGKAVFGITRFMDLTEQEFRKFHKNGGKVFSEEQIAEMMADVPEYISTTSSTVGGFMQNATLLATGSRDWRTEGKVTPVKDQGQCGSCWAFSTVEAVESAVRIAEPSSTFIGAPQELVSCDHNMDMGCNGGLPTHAYGYLKDNSLEQESDYPYKSGTSGQNGKCLFDGSKGKYKVTTYERVSHGMRIFPWTVSRGEKNMKDYMLNKGPMSIGVDATTWQTYQQGTIDAETCEPASIDHAVQVVALAQDQSGKGTWTVRNSWTPQWGESGFIRLSTDENTCLITGMATAPTVAKVTNEEETELHI